MSVAFVFCSPMLSGRLGLDSSADDRDCVRGVGQAEPPDLRCKARPIRRREAATGFDKGVVACASRMAAVLAAATESVPGPRPPPSTLPSV